MKKKEYEGLQLYDLTVGQSVTLFQLKYSTHKQIMHIATSVTTDHPLDWALLEKAFNLELERNDSLRDRFVKTKEVIRQYFVPSLTVQNVPVDDYRGMTKEKAEKTLHRRGAGRPLRFMDGEVFRVRFFRAFDGRYGVYLVVTHLIMDLGATLIFYRDLFRVYQALETGTELPKPLDRVEALLPRDLEKQQNAEKQARDRAFLREYYSEEPYPMYTGFDGMRQLDRERKRKKDPDRKCITGLYLFFDRTRTMETSIDPELTRQIDGFIAANNTSLVSLMELGYRISLGAINEKAEKTKISVLVNRRTTLAEQNSCGSRADAVCITTAVKKEQTFAEALQNVTQGDLRLFRHADYSAVEANSLEKEIWKMGPIDQVGPMVLSCIPPQSFTFEIPGWDFDFNAYSNRHFSAPDYTIILPDLHTGGLRVCYEHNKKYIRPEEVDRVHENLLTVLRLGMEDPDRTVGELMDAVTSGAPKLLHA